MLMKDIYFLIQESGKLVVLGSCHMFSDQYIDKEENSKIMVGPVEAAVQISALCSLLNPFLSD